MNESNPRALEDARTYHAAHSAALDLPPWTDAPATVTAEQDAGRLAGAAFDRMPHEPNAAHVRAAYEQMKREVKAQYDHIVARGLKIAPWTAAGQPYTSSADMRAKVARDHALFYFPSKGGFGSDDRFNDHPLMEQVPGMPEGTVYNDLFRAVHDYFGHAVHPHQFGPTGEIRAWAEHGRLFSPLARRALTTETHGQNSWVNFGPHNPERLPITERPYADQKAGVLPEDVWPKVRLARHKDIKRHKDYWSFLNHLADGQESGQPFDQNTAKVFADWLQEHGDARAHVARNATSHFIHDESGTPIAHPALPDTPPAQTYALPVNQNEGRWERPGWSYAPVEAFRDNASNGVTLSRIARSHLNVSQPLLYWSVHIPRTVSTTKKMRSVGVTAPVTADQLHDFIDAMPNGKVKATWKTVAHREGWHRTETPTKLARNENKVQGAGSAVRSVGSDNHAERLKVAQRILSEAGLQPSTVKAVMSHTDSRGVRPAVAAVIHAPTNPALARYAAAWIGLMTGERGVTVFHPQDDGNDTLHIIDSPFGSSHVGEYLRRAGVPTFTLETHPTGTRAYVVNPRDLIDVPTAARGIHGRNTALRGTAVRVGAGASTDADARATYRSVIHAAERSTGSTPGEANPLG